MSVATFCVAVVFLAPNVALCWQHRHTSYMCTMLPKAACASCPHFVHFHRRRVLLLLLFRTLGWSLLRWRRHESRIQTIQFAFWARARRNVAAAAAEFQRFVVADLRGEWWRWQRRRRWRRQHLTALSVSICVWAHKRIKNAISNCCCLFGDLKWMWMRTRE